MATKMLVACSCYVFCSVNVAPAPVARQKRWKFISISCWKTEKIAVQLQILMWEEMRTFYGREYSWKTWEKYFSMRQRQKFFEETVFKHERESYPKSLFLDFMFIASFCFYVFMFYCFTLNSCALWESSMKTENITS